MPISSSNTCAHRAPHLPYTAVMFVEGAILGVVYGSTDLRLSSHLGESITLWININPNVLLLIFLPALLFGDALEVNYHLFRRSFVQTAWLAFPGMLFGTVLTAVFAFFVLPYGWSFNLSMTFGSILAATDPVAVVRLLDEVGAPPRLRMLIAGESMLNDGAAIVLFSIFKSLYLFEGTGGLFGRGFSVGDGFAAFFQESLGGVAIGIAWGFVLIVLFRLFNRRFVREDTIVQVTITITIAYLCYYTADEIAHTSGVLSVVFCGILAAAFAIPKIHDITTLVNVWEAIEHLGNTLLFAVGGVVWGNYTSVGVVLQEDTFVAKDWGYLILLVVMMVLIRAAMVFCSYPVIANTGLKTNPKEAGFMVWGGLRGAVGIALALALDNTVMQFPDSATEKHVLRKQTIQVVIFVGGVSLLTLLVAGTSSPWVLKKVGLVKISVIKREISKASQAYIRTSLVHKYVELTTDEHFSYADVGTVCAGVNTLNDAAHEIQLLQRNQNMTHGRGAPNTKQSWVVTGSRAEDDILSQKTVLPETGLEQDSKANALETEQVQERGEKASSSVSKSFVATEKSYFDELSVKYWKEALEKLVFEKEGKEHDQDVALKEGREVFLEFLRVVYWEQIRKGELYYKFSVYALLQALDIAREKVGKGSEICDWRAVKVVSNSLEAKIDSLLSALLQCFLPEPEIFKLQDRTLKIFLSVAFIRAHRAAQTDFALGKEFGHGERFNGGVEVIIQESEKQIREAQAVLDESTPDELRAVISHMVAAILLNHEATLIARLKDDATINEKEGEHLLHDVSNQIANLKFRFVKNSIRFDPLSRLRSTRWSIRGRADRIEIPPPTTLLGKSESSIKKQAENTLA